MSDELKSSDVPTSTSKITQFLKNKTFWNNVRRFCCQCPKEVRIFWGTYIGMLLILLIIFLVAFLQQPTLTIAYIRWYNDSCTIDVSTASTMIECDSTLRLYCSSATAQCACLENMYWNSSFCDCAPGMFYTGTLCQPKLVFGQACSTQSGPCMEYLTCSTSSNTCDCPSTEYYNQTTCNPRLAFNATQPCTLTSECVSGLICSSNMCTCPSGQSWNGNGCSNLSTNGQYCLNNSACDSSVLLSCNTTYSRCSCAANAYWDNTICRPRLNNGSSCNNTQQCYSNLICSNSYCQCPLMNTQYWSTTTSTCQLCFGQDLFLFAGICYRIPLPKNATTGTYSVLSSSYTLSTIEYDYQLNYIFGQHVRVYSGTPIYFAAINPIANYFQWAPTATLIKPSYFCNDTNTYGYVGYSLSFKIQTNSPCLTAWNSTTQGQLVAQLNSYAYHTE